MTRFNVIRKFAGTRESIAWGKNTSALIFAALLIVCSITVGCSSDKPKPANSTSQIAVTQNPAPSVASSMPASIPEPAKPAKKVVKKRPATVTYNDKTYGVSFDYPRRYAIETGDAANDLVASTPLPLNFVQPGGIALAAVELPETSYTNTDFSSAFFNVSVHKALTAEQCGEFSVPAPKPESKPESQTDTKPETKADAKPSPANDATSPSAPVSTASVSTTSEQPASVPAASSAPEPQGSKLMLGDMELRGTEAVSGEGTRQSDAKYFHVFQNGACYEFALNVTTMSREDAGMKHVDRDKVFARLEQILSTVKINPVAAEPKPAETAASVPATPAAPETPVQ
jgi:hypothetical protein